MKIKEYTFLNPPSIFIRKRNVTYVTGTSNEAIKTFLDKEYYIFKRLFANKGLNFHYLSGELRDQYSLGNNDVIRVVPTSDYLRIYYSHPFKKNGYSLSENVQRFFEKLNSIDDAEDSTEIEEDKNAGIPLRLCFKNDKGGYDYIYPDNNFEEIEFRYKHIDSIVKDIDSELFKYIEPEFDTDYSPCLVFSDKVYRGKVNKVTLKAVFFDSYEDLWNQMEIMAGIIASYFPECILRKMPHSGFAADASIRDFSSDMDHFIQRMLEAGYGKRDIENLLKSKIRELKNGSNIVVAKDFRIVVTKDFRILIEEFNNKELKLKDLTKALYLFYLKRNCPVNTKDLMKYMPELTYIYIKIRKSTSHTKPLKTIYHLVLEQYPTNFSKIRNEYQQLYDKLARKNKYTIEKKDDKDVHRGLFVINLPEKFRVWQCPDILNKKIPTLPANTKDSIKETWKILHELHDSKIDAAIGKEPPTR